LLLRCFIVLFIGFCTLLLFGAIAQAARHNWFPPVVLGYSVLLFMLAAWHLVSQQSRYAAMRARLKAAKGEICTVCGYDLSRHPTAIRCPECGSEWNSAKAVAAWKTWVRRW